jgi:hypothetical protein
MYCAYQIGFLFNSSTYFADVLQGSVDLQSLALGSIKDVEHECEYPRLSKVPGNMLIKRQSCTRTRSARKGHCFFQYPLQTPFNADNKSYDALLVAPLPVASILGVG